MEFHSATCLDPACQCSRLPGYPTMRSRGSEHLQAPGEAEEAHTDFRIKPVKALWNVKSSMQIYGIIIMKGIQLHHINGVPLKRPFANYERWVSITALFFEETELLCCSPHRLFFIVTSLSHVMHCLSSSEVTYIMFIPLGELISKLVYYIKLWVTLLY